MGLVNPYMVKNAMGLGTGASLELEADPGQSFLVKDIMVSTTNSLFTDITIDKAMVGRIRTGKALGSHLSYPYGMATHDAAAESLRLKPRQTILGLLGDRGTFKGYPVGEGQKLVISPADLAHSTGIVSIVYEEYEGGDISSEDENGSESTEYMIINYGDVGRAITDGGNYHVNTQNSPTEFPQFPIDKVVPAKTEIDLIGILASEAYDYDAGLDWTYTTYLKLVRERTVLFDDDRNGLLFLGGYEGAQAVGQDYGQGQSVIGNYSDVDIKKPYFLPEPMTFGAGEELNVFITAVQSTSAGEIPQAGTEVGFIMLVRRVA